MQANHANPEIMRDRGWPWQCGALHLGYIGMTKSATKPRLMEQRGTALPDPVKLLLHCCRAALLRDGQYPKRGHTAKERHGTQWMAVIRKEMGGRAYHGEHPVGVLT